MLKRLLNRSRKLPQTQAEMDAEADAFLAREGFPVNEDYRTLFGSFIQHSNDNDDTYESSYMAKRIRKAIAKNLAFYLIHPSRRPKAEEKSDEPKPELQEIKS